MSITKTFVVVNLCRGGYAPMSRVAQLCAFIISWAESDGQRSLAFQRRASASCLAFAMLTSLGP